MNDSIATHDSTESQLSCTNIQPLALNFFERERAYAIVQCKLGLLKSEKDNSNRSSSSVKSFQSREISRKLKNSLIVEILRYAGFRQDIYFLLLNLSKNSQRLVFENRHVLEPMFIEGNLVIERYLSGDKDCIQNYQRGIKVR